MPDFISYIIDVLMRRYMILRRHRKKYETISARAACNNVWRPYMRDTMFYIVLIIIVLVVFAMPIMCIYNSSEFKPHIFCSVPMIVFVGGIIALSIIGVPKKYALITGDQYAEIITARTNITWAKLMREHMAKLREPGGVLSPGSSFHENLKNPADVAEYITIATAKKYNPAMISDEESGQE